jgi:hypothetical protein
MVVDQLAGFARLLAGDRPDLRAALIASQFLGMVWVRFVVPLEPIASMAGSDLAEWLGPMFQLALDAPLEEVA